VSPVPVDGEVGHGADQAKTVQIAVQPLLDVGRDVDESQAPHGTVAVDGDREQVLADHHDPSHVHLANRSPKLPGRPDDRARRPVDADEPRGRRRASS
jgi:hypothetical protein